MQDPSLTSIKDNPPFESLHVLTQPITVNFAPASPEESISVILVRFKIDYLL